MPPQHKRGGQACITKPRRPPLPSVTAPLCTCTLVDNRAHACAGRACGTHAQWEMHWWISSNVGQGIRLVHQQWPTVYNIGHGCLTSHCKVEVFALLTLAQRQSKLTKSTRTVIRVHRVLIQCLFSHPPYPITRHHLPGGGRWHCR
jgi:hypothetical protein